MLREENPAAQTGDILLLVEEIPCFLGRMYPVAQESDILVFKQNASAA